MNSTLQISYLSGALSERTVSDILQFSAHSRNYTELSFIFAWIVLEWVAVGDHTLASHKIRSISKTLSTSIRIAYIVIGIYYG